MARAANAATESRYIVKYRMKCDQQMATCVWQNDFIISLYVLVASYEPNDEYLPTKLFCCFTLITYFDVYHCG